MMTMLLVSSGVLAGLIVGWIVLLRSLFLFVIVKGASMAPTLHHQDRVLVLRTRVAGTIKKETIVLLDGRSIQQRPSSGASLIKRVVAVAGEIYPDPTTGDPAQPVEELPPLKERKSWQIPPGMIFVCGDNLVVSRDSREWGPVPLSAVQGVVIHMFKRAHPSPSRYPVTSR